MEEVNEQKMLFQSAIRRKIFAGSELMKESLQNSNFVVSKQFPTQVITIDNRRYVRVNEADIHEDSIDSLLSTMLGIDEFKDEDVDLNTVLQKSIKLNRELDAVDCTKNLIEVDDFQNITNLDTIPIQKQIVAVTEEEKEKEREQTKQDEEDGGDVTDAAKRMSNAMDAASSPEDAAETPQMSYQVEQELEQTLAEVQMHQGKSYFHANESMFNIEELNDLKKQANALLKAFKGAKGRTKRLSPSKRISARDMSMDKDKVYISKFTGQGKFIHMNFLIDCSGSMSGYPMRNAVAITYIFNQLAKAGHLKMTVLYSESSHNHKLVLPVEDSEILSLHLTGGSEGLTRTINQHVDCIKNTNMICLTDGNLADEGIDKKFWDKNKIITTGVYVNKKAKKLTEYTGSLSKWFNHSIVRKDVTELIQALVRIGLK